MGKVMFEKEVRECTENVKVCDEGNQLLDFSSLLLTCF